MQAGGCGGLGGALCRLRGWGVGTLQAGAGEAVPVQRGLVEPAQSGSGPAGLSRPLPPPPLLSSKLSSPLHCPTTYSRTVNSVPEEAVASPSGPLHALRHPV